MTGTVARPRAVVAPVASVSSVVPDEERLRVWRPSREGLATVLVAALVFLIAVRPALDNDLWFHLRTARWMLDHHRWVGADPFTHTRPSVHRVQTDWLAQLGYYGVWRLGGLTAVALAVAAVATGAMVLLFKTLPGRATIRGGVVLLTAATSSIFWSARPQMVTFLGTVLVLVVLRAWRRQPDRMLVWWLVPLFLVWVNCHGGVVYGVMILLAWSGGEVVNRLFRRDLLPPAALRRLAAVTAACVAVLVVNPSGVRVYGLPFHQVSSSTRFVQEYQPPSLTQAMALPFFLMLVLTVGLLVWRWRAWDGVELALVAMGAFFALQFTRSVPLFAVLAAPTLARHLTERHGTRSDGRPERDRRRADGGEVAIVALLVTGVVVLASSRARPPEARLRAEFPVAAVQWMDRHQPPHELFNTFDWGGYVMWAAPGYRVSVDGRTDVYDDYLDVYDDTVRAEPGWQHELERERIGTVLVDPGLPLTTALRADPAWHVAYSDGTAVVFTRAAGPPGGG